MIEMTVIFWIFVFIVAVAWVLLPFAMFGMKPLMRELIAQQRITNHHLAAMQNAEQAAQASAAIAAQSVKTVELSAPWEK